VGSPRQCVDLRLEVECVMETRFLRWPQDGHDHGNYGLVKVQAFTEVQHVIVSLRNLFESSNLS